MRPFKAARAFVRKLKLKSQKEWTEWCKSGMRPPNIPANPYKVYGDEFISFPDFLGYAPKRGAAGRRVGGCAHSTISMAAAAAPPRRRPPPAITLSALVQGLALRQRCQCVPFGLRCGLQQGGFRWRNLVCTLSNGFQCSGTLTFCAFDRPPY